LISINLGEGCGLCDTRSELIGTDGNSLEHLAPSRPMLTVKSIKLSDNDMSAFELSGFPKLRTLYADGNRLTSLEQGVGRLENLSLRSQRVPLVRVEKKVLESVKRLYISGTSSFSDSRCN